MCLGRRREAQRRSRETNLCENEAEEKEEEVKAINEFFPPTEAENYKHGIHKLVQGYPNAIRDNAEGGMEDEVPANADCDIQRNGLHY